MEFLKLLWFVILFGLWAVTLFLLVGLLIATVVSGVFIVVG